VKLGARSKGGFGGGSNRGTSLLPLKEGTAEFPFSGYRNSLSKKKSARFAQRAPEPPAEEVFARRGGESKAGNREKDGRIHKRTRREEEKSWGGLKGGSLLAIRSISRKKKKSPSIRLSVWRGTLLSESEYQPRKGGASF